MGASVAAFPASARALDGLSDDDVQALGREAADLLRLRAEGVPVARGWGVPLEEISAEALTTAAVQADFSLGGARPAPAGRLVSLRPWCRSEALASRVVPLWPAVEDTRSVEVLARELERVSALLGEPRARAALALSPGGLRLRAVLRDEGAFGMACSVDPRDGDPSSVAVWLPGSSPWVIDRKTMRPVEEGHGPLPRSAMERAADLADRAQLALGRPVELDWVLLGGRPTIAAVRSASVTYRFTDENYRQVSLLWHDEGPIAPLAVDVLDKALRRDDDPLDVARVRRVFARAYRRVDDGGGRPDERGQSLAAAAARAARELADATRPISAARTFLRTLDKRLAAFDADVLSRLEDAELLRALRERQRVTIEACELLDRARKATATLVGAVEAAVGNLPRECVQGLAAVKRTRARRRLDERLARLGRQLGQLASLDPAPAEHRRELAELRRELASVRPLGLDVRALPYGESDATLLAGMRVALEGRGEQAEQAQRQAVRRLLATARGRPLGSARAALARTLALALEQVSEAKGGVADGLASASLRLRAAAVEVGARLVERGVLDEPDDALHLYVGEMQEALHAEPGAYAARVRQRREEDLRWRALEPPQRLLARMNPRGA